MTSEVWQPLSARLVGRGDLREGVPAVLREPLRRWIYRQALGNARMVERVLRRLDLGPEEGSEVPAAQWLAHESRTRDLIDIADAILSFPPREVSGISADLIIRVEAQSRAAELQDLLDDVRSVYTVRKDGSCLERRASAAATRAFEAAIRGAAGKPDAGSAAGHLRAAWAAVHSLRPEPGRGYGEAVKAVEAAAHVVVEPNNARATLGTMIGQLRDNPRAFRVALSGPPGRDGVTVVSAMMGLLWDGQTSRHGGKEPTHPETLDEARMAVSLAVTLVEWFVFGAIGRV
jgi:hypothetical protein